MLHTEVFLTQISLNPLPGSDFLSPSSKIRLATIQSLARAQQFILGRLLLAQAASKVLGIEYRANDITEGEFFPCLLKAPHLHASISHSGDCLGVTVNTERVGLDIECCRPKANIAKLAKFALHRDEADWVNALKEESQERFYQLWTLREAAFKAGIRDQVIRGSSLIAGDSIKVDWYWASERERTHRVSIACLAPCSMVLIHKPGL
ncbi:4'-phosphopantetheinyl transferase family protein [Iodobacter ciconiae]|uniref:4'-phosphopantetheinyl transferase superfamily protein n=1 Tax=Iodobacter ciconiae TaxID=2496266 RepID=A0A3S8ZV71_9NEIS|nr:4'-phosphopantetheinyl transferase superfamily protein [Iodobacter ciconiae]AZN37359.1 4'-phosphopantetheinyl transferase superfamily protein [Iodobacter ciconiae]